MDREAASPCSPAAGLTSGRRPAPGGDDYDDVIDKYWRVVRVLDDGRLLLRTPGGKLHEIHAGDNNLRRPSWRERLWLCVFDRRRLRALRHRGD